MDRSKIKRKDGFLEKFIPVNDKDIGKQAFEIELANYAQGLQDGTIQKRPDNVDAPVKKGKTKGKAPVVETTTQTTETPVVETTTQTTETPVVETTTEETVKQPKPENPKRIEWDRDYDPSLPDLESDKDQLIQAILNIIQNANEATANIGNPRITIRIRSARQFTIGALRHKIVLKIEIIDNGTGIAPEMAERIFFPMITDKPSGSGLGLSIAQTVLAQHQGSIQVDSKPGSTKFLKHLPFTQIRGFKAGEKQ